MMSDDKLNLFAWVQHDHFDSLILKHLDRDDVLVTSRQEVIDTPKIERQLQFQANASGVAIRLVRLVEVETIRILQPREGR